MKVAFFALMLFLCHSVEFFYADKLRAMAKANDAKWETYHLNGETSFAVPWLCDIQYIPKIKQIFVHGVPTDPYIRENRGIKSWIFDSVQFYIIAGWCSLFNRIDTGWTFFSYFVPSLWVILFCLFFRKIYPEAETNSFLIGGILFGAFGQAISALMFSPNMGKFLWSFINFGVMNRGVVSTIPSPHFTSLFVFVWLGFLVFSKSDILLGLFAGLLLLIHPPEWMFAMAVTGVLCLFNPERLKMLLTAILTSGLILWLGSTGEAMTDRLTYISNPLRWISILYIAAGVLALRNKTPFWSIGGYAMLAVGILINCDLIIQKPIYFQMFDERFGRPMLFFMGFAFVAERIKAKTYMVWAILALVFFNAKSSAEKHFLLAGLPQYMEKSLSELNDEGNIDYKVWTLSPVWAQLATMYTPCKTLFGSGHPVISSVTSAENMRLVAEAAKKYGATKEQFINFYYPGRMGNRNLKLFFDRERNLDSFMWGLQGFINIEADSKASPYLAEILKRWDE